MISTHESNAITIAALPEDIKSHFFIGPSLMLSDDMKFMCIGKRVIIQESRSNIFRDILRTQNYEYADIFLRIAKE